MNELRQSNVTRVRVAPGHRPADRRHPLELFADHAVAARLWCGVAMVAAGFCVVQPFLVIRAYRTRERVVIMDGSGTYHVSPLLGFEEAARLHEEHALLACVAVFSRNPAGFDHPELLERLLLPEARRQAREEWAREAGEFAGKALHQKAEVMRLKVLETRDEQVLVQAEGQLIRTGSVGGQAFTEAPAFTCRFTFARNPDLAANGRFPLALWKYAASY